MKKWQHKKCPGKCNHPNFAGAGLQIGAAVTNKALAGSGNALLNTLSVSGSYNYNSGFSGGVSINTGGAQEFERRDGLNFGLNYNEQTGFGTTTGLTTGFFNYGYGISGIGHSSGTYGSAYMGFTSGDQGDYWRNSFDMNYNFRDNSFGGGVSVLQDYRGFDPNSTFFDTFSTSLKWNSEAGFNNQIQYTLSNRGIDAVTGFMQSMGNNMANVWNGLGYMFGGRKPDMQPRIGFNLEIPDAYSDSPLMPPDMKEKGLHLFPTENPDFVAELQPDGSYVIRQRTIEDNLINTHTIDPYDSNHEDILIEGSKIAGVDYTMDMIDGVRSNDIPEGLLKFIEVIIFHTSKDSLTFKSHYGDLQHLHSMADGSGIRPQITKEKILDAISDLHALSILKDDEGKYIFDQATRDRLVGSALHIIQDSFVKGHVWRNEQGEILMFQDYTQQNSRFHGYYDHSGKNDPNAYSRSVGATAVYLSMVKNGTSTADMRSYLSSYIYPLADDAMNSGTAPWVSKRSWW